MRRPGTRDRHRSGWGTRSAAAAAVLALAAADVSAQTVPVGFQEYHVLGQEQHVWAMMCDVAESEGISLPTPAGVNSVVSATATADNQVIYYDHWEDGFEAAIDTPVQNSTLVAGDGNPANGDACQFNPLIACGPDLLLAGDFVNFNSDQGLTAGTGGCQAPPNDQFCSVPLTAPVPIATCTALGSLPTRPAPGPNCSSGCRFDGGDRLFTSGGPLSVVHTMDPLSPFIGGATEMLSQQAVQSATAYTIPVGVDTYGGNDTVTEPFKYVDIDLVAFEDNTQVFVQSPGAGSVSFTLNKGQHYSSRGNIDGGPAPPLTINAGTRVSTTGPISGLIFTAGDGTYATRFYALLPDIMHSTDYVITAPGDDPALQGSRPLNLYMFNPDPLNDINVTLTDSAGSTNVVIPAGQVLDYDTATGRFVPTGSTVRLVSDRNFWGVSAYDHQGASNDWGHSWLARSFLTETYTVSYAPGVNNPPAVFPSCGPAPCDTLNRSPVFVAATQDNTCVRVDLNNDGVFDLVDTFGDDAPNAFAGIPTCADGYLIDALQALRIYDHTDYDNTGTLVVASKPVALAYGQDTDQATGPDPIQDTGYTVYPINQDWLDPVLTIRKNVTPTSVPTAGGPVRYTLVVQSYDFGPLTSLNVFDCLPAGVSGPADYAPGSTLITYPNLVQATNDPAIVPGSPNCPAGRDELNWALAPDTLQARQRLTVSYTINVPSGGVAQLTNVAHADATLAGSTFSALDTADVVRTDVRLVKSVAHDGSPEPGEPLTYSLLVSNLGGLETNVVILDPIPANTTFIPGSITGAGPFTVPPAAYDPAQNAVVWTTPALPPDLLSGGPHSLTFQVRINAGVAAGAVIPNAASYESDQTPSFSSNQVQTVVVGPSLTATKTGGPSPLHPNEVATFEVNVRNTGAGSANNVQIVDAIPPNTSYLAGSMEWRRNAGVFVALTDLADADQGTFLAGVPELRFLLSSLNPNEDLTFRFRVLVDPGTAGGFVNNQATIGSAELGATTTNLVQIPVAGETSATGHVFLDQDGDGVQDPGEPDLANVDVVVTDSTGVSQVVSTDASGNWTAFVDHACYQDGFAAVAYDGSDGLLDWSGAGDQWTEFTDQGDADQNPSTPTMLVTADPLGVFGNSLLIEDGPGGTPSKGFTRRADLSAGAGFNQGVARLSFDFRRVAFEGADVVTLDVDYDDDGVFNDVLGSFAIPGGGSDGTWQSASFLLDSAQLPDDPVVFRFVTTGGFSSGTDDFFVDNVRICNLETTADVDESDPDFPAGAVLTTANDPQTAIPAGALLTTTPVGYQPSPITFTKTSDSVAGQVSPGQTLTYTLTVTNSSGVTQTGIDVSDPVPAGTSYVPGSSQVTLTGIDALRVSEYFVAPGDFGGTVHDLTLNQTLAPDYFVIVQGSAGSGGGGGDRGPDENYARLTEDPSGTGDLTPSSGANVIRLERVGGADDWVGVVTVVECLADCAANGFTLLDVQEVAHAGGNPAALAGTDTVGTAWTDINQAMLMGGFNGAGCSTAEATDIDQKVCHVRFEPQGTNTISWTRSQAGSGAFGGATSTVMAIEWGSQWTVQRRRLQGSNGGNGANAVGEYNTVGIASVVRDNTWVWGTGFTDEAGVGEAAEGVLLTLGDGVNQNANETSLAAATEFGGTAIDFEVYALTHAGLAVDYRFKTDGDGGALTFDVAVDAATSDRMALSYNGVGDTNDNYPTPMFSARYLNDTTVRLERRRTGDAFPAWVQGIDYSNIAQAPVSNPGNPPAGLVVPADGYTLAPGQTMTVTFQVVVDDPLAPAVTQIANTGTVTTDTQGPFDATVVDDVVRVGVVVEPNNAGFTTAGSTISYDHAVVNTGTLADSFALTVDSERGWRVELIDPDTGVVIATDSDGDGVWDGGVTVNTGTLGVGESQPYQVRITVPGGTAADTQDTTRLIAASDRNPGLTGEGTDETTVLDPADIGPVILVPDQSGVVAAGGTVAYPHRVFNNTGATDTFDLFATPTLPGWTATWYFDNDGNGVYTPGVDIAVNNTAQLADGESQLLFLVHTAPVGANPGDSDVANLAAVSRNDTDLLDTASDTTTVLPASTHDLAGGGTFLMNGGETAVFPGTLFNLGNAPDTFDFDIGPSRVVDSFAHPTELWIDTDNDGVVDLHVATDSTGDGTWDVQGPGWVDTDGDGEPEVTVAAGGQLHYELRRALDPNQRPLRDPVTLTAIAHSTGERDSVTATNLLAVATLAVLSDFHVGIERGEVVVSWSTASEAGTLGFFLERREGSRGRFRRLHRRLLPGLLNAPQGGDYRFVDDSAVPGRQYQYRLVEQESRGTQRILGPFQVALEAVGARDGALPPAETEGPELGSGVPAGGPAAPPEQQLQSEPSFERQARRTAIRRSARAREPREGAGDERAPGAGSGSTGETGTARAAEPSLRGPRGPRGTDAQAKLTVRSPGLVLATAQGLAQALGASRTEVERWIRRGLLRVHNRGREVSWLGAPNKTGIYFFAEAIDSIYTEDNVYWVSFGAGRTMRSASGGRGRGEGPASFRERLHVEQEFWGLLSVTEDPDGDFWFWDFLIAGVPGYDHKQYQLQVPGPAPEGTARLQVHLQGASQADADPDHNVLALFNGEPLEGEGTWDGTTAKTLSFELPQSLLLEGTNTLELVSLLQPGVGFDFVYLDSFDLDYERRYSASGDALLATADSRGDLRIDGFTAEDVTVLDVTDPLAPVVVRGARVAPDGAGYAVSFRTRPASRYLALRLATAAPPLRILADEPSQLADPGNRGEYLVIAPEGLEAGAAALAELRRNEGLTAVVARLEDVHDEFNHGIVSPLAIRELLRHAAKRWAVPPRYVVLAGDGTYDYNNRMGFAGNLLPPAMVATPNGLVPSDNRLADLEGDDGVPELAIGRIPVQSAAELDSFVAKAAAYGASQGAWRARTLWLADDPDEGGEFVDDSERLLGGLGSGLSARRLFLPDLGTSETRRQLFAGLLDGAVLLSYLGHGGLDRLADEGLLVTADVPGLGNADRLPVVAALTCVVGRFDTPGFDSLGEALLLDESGGAIALLAPSGFSMNAGATTVGEGMLAAATSGAAPRLGDAVLAGLRHYRAVTADPEAHLPFIYSLLGDPATLPGWSAIIVE